LRTCAPLQSCTLALLHLCTCALVLHFHGFIPTCCICAAWRFLPAWSPHAWSHPRGLRPMMCRTSVLEFHLFTRDNARHLLKSAECTLLRAFGSDWSQRESCNLATDPRSLALRCFTSCMVLSRSHMLYQSHRWCFPRLYLI